RAAAFSRSTTEERAAARLLFIGALRFFICALCALRLATSEKAAGTSLLFLRLPRLLPLPALCGERVGARGIMRLGSLRAALTRIASRSGLSPHAGRGGACGTRLRKIAGHHRGGRRRHWRLHAVIDHRAMVLAGERILPLEGVEPAAHRRDRQP